MPKTHYKPSKYLSKYIDRYFVCSQNKGLPLILPGTGLELLFHLNTPLSIANQELNTAHIICPRKSLQFDNLTNVNYISVRFHSGAFRHFTTIPYKYIIDNYLSVEDIWCNEGTKLLNKLSDFSSITKKIQLIDTFLCTQLAKNLNYESINWNATIKTLYKNYNTITLHELATHCNLSYRQFERNFKQHFGTTPKKFQRTTRLQKTVKNVLLSKNKHYLHTALDCGFYDQSHFIKEFKYFSGIKPSEYFIAANFDNHFYYKPMKQVNDSR